MFQLLLKLLSLGTLLCDDILRINYFWIALISDQIYFSRVFIFQVIALVLESFHLSSKFILLIDS